MSNWYQTQEQYLEYLARRFFPHFPLRHGKECVKELIEIESKNRAAASAEK